MPQTQQFAGPTVSRQAPQQQQQDPLAGYFANLPAEELIGELKTRAINNWNALQNRGLPTLWRLAYSQLCGMDASTGQNATQKLQFCGPQASYIRFRIQLTRSHAKQRNQLAQGQRPSFKCVAANSGAQALAQAPIAGKILDHVFKAAKGELALNEALDSDGNFGEGFVWGRWDAAAGSIEPFKRMVQAKDQETGEPLTELDGSPTLIEESGEKPTGMPTYSSLYPWNISRDPNTRKPAWIETREKASKSELMARYPEHAEALSRCTLRRDTEPGALELFQWDITSATDDTVIVKHFYHRSGADVPGGRYVGYVDDIVLWDKECPLAQGLPILSICSARYFDTPFGYPENADLLSVQEAVDEIWSQAITNLLKFGNQNVWAEDGVEFDQRRFAMGGQFFTLKANQKPPQVIDFAEMPRAFEYMNEKLPAFMGEISGMNSSVRGEPESNIDSGVFASLMQSTAEKFVSSTQTAFDFLVTDTGNMTLELVRANTDTRFAAKIAGESNVSYMQYFTAEDLDGVHSVEVERQSPVLNNIGGRFEVFEKTVQLPKADRLAAVQLLTTGDSSAWTEVDLSCLILIKKENERLARGQPTDVSKTDDHILHCIHHRASLDRLRAQEPPPQGTEEFMQWQAAIMAHIQHIAQHPVLWAQTDPVFAAACSIPPPPIFNPAMGMLQPQQQGTPQSAPQPGPNGKTGPQEPGQMQAAPKQDPGMPDDPNQQGPQEKAGGGKKAPAQQEGAPA